MYELFMNNFTVFSKKFWTKDFVSTLWLENYLYNLIPFYNENGRERVITWLMQNTYEPNTVNDPGLNLFFQW